MVRTAVVVTLAAVTGAGAAIVLANPPWSGGRDCGAFRIDSTRFRDDVWRAIPADPEPVAEGIVECRALDGRSRRAVRRLLGRPALRTSEGWWLYVGREATGWDSDARHLSVEFGPDGRVSRTSLH